MDPDKLSIDSIFSSAAALADPSERAAYLKMACAADGPLRERLERLLDAQQKVAGFLETPAFGIAADADERMREGPGTVIGAYKLMEQIGEGGMGLVFVAEQRQPVRRKVALKVIKPGMDTRQIVARFEAERQALALMDHPNIAKVYDGGETSSGRPYFVMELVKGTPITQFCDDNRLTPRDRLELFVHVCEAVQHAHQKGIIHRDLKPSNVLVALHDGNPTVKVIDFGVAKAIQQRLTDKTVYTQFSQWIGTPLYMAPEQAADSGLDVDTRSDIYSLGVLLYELLTGTTPFDGKRLKDASFEDMRRIIRDEEAPKPSSRISTLGQAAGTVSDNRKSDPKRLRRQFRGELDWIALKALEKDRNRRYATANALAADVQRYLRDEPVQACPPSALYRFRKFARRNKAALATALLIGAALISALATLIVSNVLINDERREALRQRDDAKAQRQLARRAVDRMYTQVAEKWLAQQPRLEPLQKEFLEEALRFYQGFAEEPSADPELRLEAARAYRRMCEIRHKLGDIEVAGADLHRAIALTERLVAEFPENPNYRSMVGECRLKLGGMLSNLEQLDEAEAQFRTALLMQEKLVADYPDKTEYRHELSVRHEGLANLQLYRVQVRDAAKSYGVAIKLLESLPREWAAMPGCRFHLACDLSDLGWALSLDGQTREALALGRRAVGVIEKLVGDFPHEPHYRGQLAHALRWLGSNLPKEHFSEAELLLRRALTVGQSIVSDFPSVPNFLFEVILCRRDLGDLLRAHGRPPEAETEFAAVDRLTDDLLTEHVPSPAHGINLCGIRAERVERLVKAGRLQEAESMCRKSKPMAEKLARAYPANHRFRFYAALCDEGLGMALAESSRPDEAEPAYRRALSAWTALMTEFPKNPEYRWALAQCHGDLAELLVTSPAKHYWNAARAIQLVRRAIELQPDKRAYWNTLGTAHYRAGDWNASVRVLELAALAHGDCQNWLFLAMANWRQGRKDKARDWYQRAHQWIESNAGKLDEDRGTQARFRRFRTEAEDLMGIALPAKHQNQVK